MSKKVIPLDELESVLEGLFGLSDGELSEDGNESDELENEAVFVETTQELESVFGILPSSAIQDTVHSVSESIVTPSSSGFSLPSTSIRQDSNELQSDHTENSVINRSELQTISESEEDDDDDTWKKTYFPHNAPIEKFDDIKTKATHRFPSRSSPLAYVQRFLSEEVMSWIVDQTNLYVSQNNQKNWVNVTIAEIQAFIGMSVLMRVHPLPNIGLYWSSDPLFCVQEISEVMTSKRFKMILRNLHLNDNTKMPKRGEPQYDKLYKIRPMINFMNAAFQREVRNSSSQSIDECMVKLKGRNSLKQYMPNKPVKRGFKVWARCDSATGYLYEFEIYTGKNNNETEIGLGASVLNGLCKSLIDEKMEVMHVTYDNFFSSTELMQNLFENKIYSTATVRSNRTNLPLIIKKQVSKKSQPKRPTLKHAKGKYKWRVNKNVAAFSWMDTKLVNILSTAYHPKDKVTCKRTQKDGTKQDISCPLGVVEYTKRMGGVDRFDQKRGSYNVSRKSRRWWMRIFYFLIDAAITNAYILYAENARYPISPLRFRTMLGRSLIGGFTSRKKRLSNLPNFVTKKPKLGSRQKTKYGLPDDLRLTDVGSHLPGPLETHRRC